MSGHDHILVTWPILAVLEQCCRGQYDGEAAVIYDPVARAEHGGYTRIQPHAELTPEKLREGDYGGDMWHFRRSHLFVSDRTRIALVASRVDGLSFDPGFSGFA
jgi:hypothetical protein